MFSTLSFTLEALDGMARSAGYAGASEAHAVLTAEPSYNPYGAFEATHQEVVASGETKTWAGTGLHILSSHNAPRVRLPKAPPKVRLPKAPPGPVGRPPGRSAGPALSQTRTNAERNAGRRLPPEVDLIRAYRAEGLTAGEQAAELNRQAGWPAWTAARVRHTAHQAGLTRTPARRGRAVAGRG